MTLKGEKPQFGEVVNFAEACVEYEFLTSIKHARDYHARLAEFRAKRGKLHYFIHPMASTEAFRRALPRKVVRAITRLFAARRRVQKLQKSARAAVDGAFWRGGP